MTKSKRRARRATASLPEETEETKLPVNSTPGPQEFGEELQNSPLFHGFGDETQKEIGDEGTIAIARILSDLHKGVSEATKVQVELLQKHLEAITITVKNTPQNERVRKLDVQGIPEKLSDKATLADFNRWLRKWNDYVEISQLSQFPMNMQVSALNLALSDELIDLLKSTITVAAQNSANPTCMEKIKAIEIYIRGKVHVALDRIKFFQRRQEDGESIDDFHSALCNLARIGQMEEITLDQIMVTLVTMGINDEQTRQKVMATHPLPTQQVALEICRREENARKSSTLASNSATINSQKVIPRETRKTCTFCKGYNHSFENCWKRRPFQKRIEKRVNSFEYGGNVEENKVFKAYYAKINSLHISKKAPRISVTVGIPGLTNELKVEAEPDSGAEATILPLKIFNSLGLSKNLLETNRPSKLISGTSHAFNEVGTIRCKIKYSGRETWDDVHVCENAGEFLLAWYTLIDLDILPSTYPLPIHGPASLVINNMDCLTPEAWKKNILEEFSDVFIKPEEKRLPPMKGPPMKIYIRDNAIPYALTAPRRTSIALREQVKNELQDMEIKGIITRVDNEVTQWCSPMLAVRKPNGKVRIVTDFTELNKQTMRPVYPMRTPKDAVDCINPEDKFFTTLDAVSGYWQIELDKDSQKLTTFICQEGTFKYCRAPMGLNSTGDEYNRRGDQAIAGLKNVEKVVDDMLIHSKTLQEHYEDVRKVLIRCREHGISLSREKFQFATGKVKFVGYIVGTEGIAADPEKVEAITKFPEPKNITDLRSFFGIVNQLGGFSSDIAKVAQPLRYLLQKRNEFLWSATHSAAFLAVKTALISPPVLKPFDKSLPTVLQTDASRTKGLGFVLLQRHQDNQLHLVHCGSRFISETESRYAMVELELLAVVWAMNKCRYYLLGLPTFELKVDHRPLVPILNDKQLYDIDNPRLMRLKEKILPYSFITDWVKGKDHHIPDALSRAPVKEPESEDKEVEVELSNLVIAQLQVCAAEIDEQFDLEDKNSQSDPILKELYREAQSDAEYQELLKVIQVGFPENKRGLTASLLPYYKLRNELSISEGLILYKQRLLIPKSQRKEVLRRLHLSHQGIERTKRRARQTVFWPGMNSDIENTVGLCEKCQSQRASLPTEPLQSDPMPDRPFVDVAVDFFSYAGRNFMVYVDRYSGWPEIYDFKRSDPNTDTLIKILREIFSEHGVPSKFRSDGAAMFTAYKFQNFLKEWNIKHARSAPHFPSSNGLAESAVKAMKALIKAATEGGNTESDIFHMGLLEFRNTPRANGLSPAQMILKHSMRTLTPNHQIRDSENRQTKVLMRPDSGRPLRMIGEGKKVWIQDPCSKRWTIKGMVVKAFDRNYLIRLENDKLYWRNRRHVRERMDHEKNVDQDIAPMMEQENVLRRSTRQTRPPQRYRQP